MTDIIDLFLDPENVAKMNRIFGSGSPCRQFAGAQREAVRPDCGMRAYMHEFIYGPYMAGLYDIWTGTDADLYLRHMNDEFIKFMEVRHSKLMTTNKESNPDVSARVEIASYLDPFDRAGEQERRVAMAQSRRPKVRGTGASTGGAIGAANVGNGRFPCRASGPVMGPLVPMIAPDVTGAYGARGEAMTSHLGIAAPGDPCRGSARGSDPRREPDRGRACKCRAGVSGTHAVSCAKHSQARVDGREMGRPGALADDYYARWNRDQSSSVHLASRDDEASDVGHLGHNEYFAGAPRRAAAPFDFRESNPWLISQGIWDPVSGSGEAQYHLLELDSQMSVLNEERTIPYGYGSTEDQLADDARVAARYVGREPEVGVIPKTSYKKLIRAQAPNGRVTLDDDRIMARDIFARDSKGFILAGRR
jgi:hypothetical protein